MALQGDTASFLSKQDSNVRSLESKFDYLELDLRIKHKIRDWCTLIVTEMFTIINYNPSPTYDDKMTSWVSSVKTLDGLRLSMTDL